MNDHDLINNIAAREAEKDRWAKVLGDDCCTYGECVGGYGCPVRETPAEQLVWPELDLTDDFPLRTGEGVKCQSTRAQSAIECVAINAKDSDGSDPAAAEYEWELTPFGWVVAAIAVASFLVLVYLKS